MSYAACTSCYLTTCFFILVYCDLYRRICIKVLTCLFHCVLQTSFVLLSCGWLHLTTTCYSPFLASFPCPCLPYQLMPHHSTSKYPYFCNSLTCICFLHWIDNKKTTHGFNVGDSYSVQNAPLPLLPELLSVFVAV